MVGRSTNTVGGSFGRPSGRVLEFGSDSVNPGSEARVGGLPANTAGGVFGRASSVSASDFGRESVDPG